MNKIFKYILIITNFIILILLIKVMIEISYTNSLLEKYDPYLERGKSFLENFLKENDDNSKSDSIWSKSEDVAIEIVSDLDDLESILIKAGYSYYLKDSYLIINHKESVVFYSEKLPSNIKFNNEGDVVLSSLEKLSPNTQFNNKGTIYLNVVTEIDKNVLFNNEGAIYLQALTRLADHVEFQNKGSIILDKLIEFPKGIKFENKGSLFLYALKELPKNKYELFRNDGIVYYNGVNGEEFDTRIK